MNTNRAHARRGGAGIVVVTATVVLGMAVGPLIFYAQANVAPAVAEAPTAATVASTLERCRLGAESLAAAGLDATAAAGVRQAIVTKLESDGQTLADTTASLASARSALESLKKSISGAPTPAEIAQLELAEAAVTSAETALAGTLASFVTAGEAPLTAPQKATLGTIRTNADRALPAAYLVQQLDDEAAVELRDALAAERIALKQQEEVPSGAASHLATVRAGAAVAAALSNTATNLAAIKAALSGS